MRGSAVLLSAMTAFIVTPALAENLKYSVLKPSDFAAFVMHWEPSSEPRCAVMQSAQDWSKVMHAAPVMGNKHPFEPGADFWPAHAILLVARVMNGGAEPDRVFKVSRLRRNGDSLDLGYTLSSPHGRESSTAKYYLAIATRKPLPKEVRFVESGKVICTVATGT